MSLVTTPSQQQQSPPSSLSLLSLPAEILTQIIALLLPEDYLSNLVVRWMFIRRDYQTRYLPIVPLPFHISHPFRSLLLVCRSLSDIVCARVYGLSLWKCDCRLDTLCNQVGGRNFARIRRMGVAADDLVVVADALRERMVSVALGAGRDDRDDGGNDNIEGSENIPHQMNFDALEELECEGYDAELWLTVRSAIADDTDDDNNHNNDIIISPGDHRELRNHRSNSIASRSRYAKRDALTMCKHAANILNNHPKLNILAHQIPGFSDRNSDNVDDHPRFEAGRGGADSVDTTLGRVQWRFLSHESAKRDDEQIVGVAVLARMIEELTTPEDIGNLIGSLSYDGGSILEGDRGERERAVSNINTSLPVTWRNEARFEMYPYLRAS